MKTITLTTKNQRGQESSFTITSEKKTGNFYKLIIDAPFEIENAVNGNAAITNEAILRNYSMDGFNLKSNAISQIIITPKNGTKKDRYTLQVNNNDLR